MTKATPEVLAEILGAFDVTITFDKANEFIDLSAMVLPQLLPAHPHENDYPGCRRGCLK